MSIITDMLRDNGVDIDPTDPRTPEQIMKALLGLILDQEGNVVAVPAEAQ